MEALPTHSEDIASPDVYHFTTDDLVKWLTEFQVWECVEYETQTMGREALKFIFSKLSNRSYSDQEITTLMNRWLPQYQAEHRLFIIKEQQKHRDKMRVKYDDLAWREAYKKDFIKTWGHSDKWPWEIEQWYLDYLNRKETTGV